jgi:hypothetical protein
MEDCVVFFRIRRDFQRRTQLLINALYGKVGPDTKMSGNRTSRELTRNGGVGQRGRGVHESFLVVSPYSSVSKSRGIPPS